MKLVVIAGCLAGISLFAQQRSAGAHAGRVVNPGGGYNSSYGRLVYPGSGGPVAPRYSVGALGLPLVAPPVISHPQNHIGAVIVPYPVFYGGGYYGYDAPPAPSAGGYYYDPSTGARQDSPVVIINQSYTPDVVNPSFQDYSNVQLPPPVLRRGDGAPADAAAPAAQDQPSVYLVALKDHSIVAAIGYWVEGQTLHYITQDNIHQRITLDQVDRAFTKQLNEERHIELALPPEN